MKTLTVRESPCRRRGQGGSPPESTSNYLKLDFTCFFRAIAQDDLPQAGSTGWNGMDEKETKHPGMADIVVTWGGIAGRMGVKGSDDSGPEASGDVPDTFHTTVR